MIVPSWRTQTLTGIRSENLHPAVNGKFEGKISGSLTSPFFGFSLACKIAVTKLAKESLAQLPILGPDTFPKLFRSLTVQRVFRNIRWLPGSLVFGLPVPGLELKNWQEQPVQASFPPSAQIRNGKAHVRAGQSPVVICNRPAALTEDKKIKCDEVT